MPELHSLPWHARLTVTKLCHGLASVAVYTSLSKKSKYHAVLRLGHTWIVQPPSECSRSGDGFVAVSATSGARPCVRADQFMGSTPSMHARGFLLVVNHHSPVKRTVVELRAWDRRTERQTIAVSLNGRYRIDGGHRNVWIPSTYVRGGQITCHIVIICPIAIA